MRVTQKIRRGTLRDFRPVEFFQQAAQMEAFADEEKTKKWRRGWDSNPRSSLKTRKLLILNAARTVKTAQTASLCTILYKKFKALAF
jgi:hypothetical protein